MGKTSGTRPESKSDSKFEKKLLFYSKIKDAVASLSAQKSITKKNRQQRRQNKKLKAYNLSCLVESLPEFKVSQKPGPEDNFKLTCKSRQKLLLKERERLSDVLKNPDFQSDPLAAIHQHLQRTLPVVEEPSKIKVKNNGSKNKKKSKASTGLQSMDM